MDFTSALNINLRRGDWIKVGKGDNSKIVGQQVKFKISKSKVSVPYRTGDWDLYIDEGGVVPRGHIDNFKEVVYLSVLYQVVDKAGSWFTYKDLRIQGVDNLVSSLRDNLPLYEELKAETMEKALDFVNKEIEEAIERGEIDTKEPTIEEIEEEIKAVKKPAIKKKVNKK